MTSEIAGAGGETLTARVLARSVADIGGHSRVGQQQMAAAIDDSFATGVHLLVQAGTGTGKSLGYLAPALVWAVETGQRVVVATATLALQTQLATKDIPAAQDAVEQVLGRRPSSAVLKGRSNYACLLRVRDGMAEQDALLGAQQVAEAARASGADSQSVLGSEVLALREWAEVQLRGHGLADRDDAPVHSVRAWQQVSVSARECLGAGKCPFGAECFVELSRQRAREADLVVTNHALLAIDAMHGGTALPEHDLVVIDEAHELVSRVTGAASSELSPQQLDRLAKRAAPWLDDNLADELQESGAVFQEALDATEPGRLTAEHSTVLSALQSVREVTRRAITALNAGQVLPDVERVQTSSAIKEAFDTAERMSKLDDADVIWVSERERFGTQVNVAPLSVAGLMRERVLGQATAVLTSATLTVGGGFEAIAGSVGLQRSERLDAFPSRELPDSDAELADADEERPVNWRWVGMDVGSPFDYARQGILYVARALPKPGLAGLKAETLAEIAELVWAAGGRTLGLFASTRAAEAAAAHVRQELPSITVMCQGDAQLPELTRRFIDEPESCLFGTMSLWQGIDVPGETCALVIIDKIPFPRPDDPLMQARQQAVSEAGGNGFMQVAAAHAGLLLAQGSGRLIRRLDDRGVVAVLDPRLVEARYGSFLRASMPGFWTTTDREVAISALRRLANNEPPTTAPSQGAVG